MSIHIIGAVVAALALALPYLLQLYVQRLPVAPTCPTCRQVAREAGPGWARLELVPSLATTFVGECRHCGWRGRMRWRWATRRIRGGR